MNATERYLSGDATYFEKFCKKKIFIFLILFKLSISGNESVQGILFETWHWYNNEL